MAILVFEHSANCRLDRLGAVLASYGHRLRVLRLHAGDAVPRDLDDVDGIVSLGGPTSANGNEPWLAAEMQLIREAHAEGLPVLGICLGCQIAAKALGGDVGPMEGGIELGFRNVSLSAVGREDPVFTGIAWESVQLHWHREEVKKLPAGAKVLSSSSRCKIQAWNLGLRTYGIQYHPEAYEETVHAWAKDDPGDLAEAKLSEQTLREEMKSKFSAYERLSMRLFESIALFVMPVDRRVQGLVKDLHH